MPHRLSSGWWNDAFEKAVYPLDAITQSPDWKARTRHERDFIVKTLGLSRGARVLDLCCGTGRHAIGLARLGCAVTGVDLSANYLASARREARALKGAVDFQRHDMRRLPFKGRFDAAINIFTSFGYFPRQADDLAVLRGVYRALRPGGLFLIDVVNGARLSRLTQDALRLGWAVNRWSELSDGTLALEEPEFDERRGLLKTRWIFISKTGRKELNAQVRLYTRETLGRLLEKAGFEVRRAYGFMGWERYAAERSLKLVVLARKP